MSDDEVRVAQPEDRDGLIELCKVAHSENGIYWIATDRMQAVFDNAMAKNGVMIGVIGPVGQPRACVVLSVEDCFYAAQPIIVELVNVVHPDHRQSGYAKAMIGFAKQFSDALQLPMTMGIWSNHRTAAKIRLYQRQLEPAGVFFIYNRHLAAPPPDLVDELPLAAE